MLVPRLNPEREQEEDEPAVELKMQVEVDRKRVGEGPAQIERGEWPQGKRAKPGNEHAEQRCAQE